MSSDSDKAKLAALLENLKKHVSEREAREAQEMQTGKCSRCGAQLSVAWPLGRKESSTAEPLIFCGPCYERQQDHSL